MSLNLSDIAILNIKGLIIAVFLAGKVIKRKGEKLYVKWKGYDNSFNSWIDKKDIVEMHEYYTEPNTSGGTVKVELDLCNYATKQI